MMKRVLGAPIVVALTVLVLSGCGNSDSSDKPASAGSAGSGSQTVKVVYDIDAPPFSQSKADKPVGFCVDVMREVAKRENLKLEESLMPWDGIIPALKAHQVDIIGAATTITEERKQSITFSMPYLATGLAMVTTPAKDNVTGPESLSGKKVAVRTGSSGALAVQELSNAKKIKIQTYANTNDLLQAVESGIADVTVQDEGIMQYYIQQRGGDKLQVSGPLLTHENYGFPVANDALLKKVNDGLTKMTADGTFAKLYEKWFGKTPEKQPGDIS
jgi:glutamine transport system substrate-binding protein